MNKNVEFKKETESVTKGLSEIISTLLVQGAMFIFRGFAAILKSFFSKSEEQEPKTEFDKIRNEHNKRRPL